jgi:hypothetical protein
MLISLYLKLRLLWLHLILAQNIKVNEISRRLLSHHMLLVPACKSRHQAPIFKLIQRQDVYDAKLLNKNNWDIYHFDRTYVGVKCCHLEHTPLICHVSTKHYVPGFIHVAWELIFVRCRLNCEVILYSRWITK